MKKQKGLLIFFSALLIVLGLLPNGGAFSLFSLPPYSYATYFRLITALLSCVLMCLALIYAFKNKGLGAIKVISMSIVVWSLSPIIVGMSAFSVVGIAVTAIAFAETVLSFVIAQTAE